ncbi:MAG: hypothetical protein HEQ27_03535 [Dolichospermum sp. JUN01]|nr:hypothetical protein [Dolichospermum sp. JUN01]MBS9392431.1 hypothetical protein [Dolichospermum sp. OL01]MCO5796074.1 hypothetical protein [Dolichospermum sp. OL03]MCS6282845.1 hypothetical protein [Dolichospermum sp.]QSV57719.1 MAG: hypothetical protein HEQ29_04520 [Dolichospermum sp. LBC05a]
MNTFSTFDPRKRVFYDQLKLHLNIVLVQHGVNKPTILNRQKVAETGFLGIFNGRSTALTPKSQSSRWLTNAILY